MSVSEVQFEYDKELKLLSMSVNGRPWKTLSIRDLEPMEKLLKEMEIPYESSIGEMMGDIEFLQYQYENDSLYKLGVEAGIKQTMDKIQKHCELGKPVMANGELFFFKTARQNLIDIMDDIDAEYGIERENKYIVPISMAHNNGKVEREVIIKANKPETAMLIAIGDFEHNGWIVDTNFNNYKIME